MQSDDRGFVADQSAPHKVLAFDTSGPFIAVATSTASNANGSVIEMARGQAEALMPHLEDCLTDAGWLWSDLDVIGVCTGPGNFTGIRIGVSAARGLGMGLGIPAIGVSAFDVAATLHASRPSTVVSLPAPRDMAYVQAFRGGEPLGTARLIDPSAPPDDLPLANGGHVSGFRAADIAAHFEATATETEHRPSPEVVAGLTGHLLKTGRSHPPVPLYVKPADAAPSKHRPPSIIA